MMGCVLNLVIFVVWWQKTLLVDGQIPTENTTEISLNLVEMSQGLQQLPSGHPSTQTLNLAYNHISSLPEFAFSNSSYKSLTKIELNQNKITTIHVTAFRGLKQLADVILSDNNLTSIDPYVFKHNPKLEKLDLSRNRMTLNRLQVFLVQQNLETLFLSNNRIEEIYELSFIGLPKLKNLVLDGNVLNIVAPNSFKTLNNLQYLSLANTGVYRLSESMFGNHLPRIVDLQETPLGKRFNPPLTKVTNNAVASLINIDRYIFRA